MKRLGLVLLVVLMLGLVGCDGKSQVELTETAKYEDFVLVLGESEVQDGRIIVHATYTNNSKDPYYAACCFAVRAFQNDKEITDVSDINGDEAALIREIKNEQTIDVSYVFELEDDSPVKVLVEEPTADMNTIGEKTYEW